MKIYKNILVVFLLCFGCSFARSQPEIVRGEIKFLIDSTATLLKEYYVFPEVSVKIGEHLKSQFDKGVFKSISTKREFAQLLTAEMQSVSHDKHMRCFYGDARQMAKRNSKSLIGEHDYDGLTSEKTYSFCRVGLFEKNIGLLDIYNFPGSENAKKSVDEAMETISSATRLIIDLRRNGGGDPELIRYICSYFFDKATHINSIYWRESNRTVDFITSERVNGKKMASIPIIVLTSSFTFSGGEEFAYNMLTQKRGTLIGEVTGGGANPGDVFRLNEDFRIFIPTGRAINPITKTNWEGVGVKPDILIDADKALEYALKNYIQN